jgi:hypothetical protein
MIYESNFEKVTDFDAHWLVNDCIKSIKRDIYFSIGTRYYCDAGCHVCYIRDNLSEVKNIRNTIYPTITNKMQDLWNEVFSYFDYLRTDDDMMYLKLNHPAQYDWFKQNGHKFEYGMTDNALFRFRALAKEIKFSGISSISLSSYFIERVNSEKLDTALKTILESSKIQQIKLINTGNLDVLKKYADYATNLGIEVLFHYDFNGNRNLMDKDWVETQITWMDSDTDGNMQIYGDEAICLFFDRFYYSNEGSSDKEIKEYSLLKNSFDPEQFLVDLSRGKQLLYKMWAERTKNERFRDYFLTTLKYKFNDGYNFLPGPMMPPFSRYCKKLEENGWVKTPHGLYKPDANGVRSIVNKL